MGLQVLHNFFLDSYTRIQCAEIIVIWSYCVSTLLHSMCVGLVNINAVNDSVKFCPYVIEMWSGNELQTSIKGHVSVTNLRKMTHNNTNLVNINAFTKCA